MKNKFVKIGILLFGIVFVALFFYWELTPCPTNPPLKAGANSPVAISNVKPQGKIELVCYYKTLNLRPVQRGVGVSISGTELIDYDFPLLAQINDAKELELYAEREKEHPLEERVHLYVDGRPVSNSSRRVYSYASILLNEQVTAGLNDGNDFSWLPFLLPGDHTAKVVIETLSGETIQYEWQFTITLR